MGTCSDSSTVVVRLFGSPQTSVSVADEVEQLPGLSYMFWSVFQQRRDAILPGERFRLRLQFASFPVRRGGGGGAEAGDGGQLRAGGGIPLAAAAAGRGRRPHSPLCRGTCIAVAEPEGWPATLPHLVSSRHDPGRAGRRAERGHPAGAPGRRLAGADRPPTRPRTTSCTSASFSSTWSTRPSPHGGRL